MDIPDRVWIRFWPNGATSVHTEPYDGAVPYAVVEEPETPGRERDDPASAE